MRIESFLSSDRARWGVDATSKKRILQTTADFIASRVAGVDGGALFRALIDRERLGSTGIGEGVAIPHCRMDSCQSIIGTLVHLGAPIDFQAIDGKPVDLLFVLLVPAKASDEHLKALAHLASLFNREAYRSALRGAGSDAELYRVAVDLDDGS